MTTSGPPIAIAGAGAVAQALGRLLVDSGAHVVALAGRNPAKAAVAARFIGPAVRAVSVAELPALAAHIIVSVSDEGIPVVAETLAAAGMRAGIVLHTCGALGPEALAPLGAAGVLCGLLHPLQTIVTPEQGVLRLVHVAFGVSGDEPAVVWAEEIAGRLHGRAIRIASDRLSYYHAGAVMASNALVAALDAAIALLGEAGIDEAAARGALAPLAQATVANVVSTGPVPALTGPVVRGDAATVARHLHALEHVPPTIARLYRAASLHLVGLAGARGASDSRLRAIEQLLQNDQKDAWHD
jgi:predicted short-subunit dehydrogenase-like oxidoreductase (DUF2520 family)